ncbi:MAG: MaoC/PaaZ C-terminal domain-containing protein [Bacteroidota bacterium]
MDPNTHMQETTLPSMPDMMLPTLFSLRKGKRIGEKGIHIEKSFEDIRINASKMDAFLGYFGFQSKSPLSYLYVLAQRAQIKVMLDREFTMAIPGMIHVENQLVMDSAYNRNDPFHIQAKVNVPYKKEGSLIPISEIHFLQNGKRVAYCKSTYLAKRKSVKKSPKKEKAIPEIASLLNQERLELDLSSARKYAAISGDKNPIHTSSFLAKMFGLKNAIMHGWYSVCLAEKKFEKFSQTRIEEISVHFISPISLPSRSTLKFGKTKTEEISFQVRHDPDEKVLLYGELR